MRHLKRHLSVANVLSLTALFVALAGTAYAATKLGNEAVKSNNIAAGAVKAKQLANEAVTNSKLKAGAITSGKLENKSVIGKKLAPGAVGSEAILDSSIEAKDVAPKLYQSLVQHVAYTSASTPTNSEDLKTVNAACPAGKEAIGGGVRVNGELAQVAVTGSNPFSAGNKRTGWSAFARESTPTPNNWSLTAFAICAEI